jgi:hypothetical protein
LKEVAITLVSLEQPCSACIIIEGHIKEMLSKLEKRMDYIRMEHVIIDNLKEIHRIEGLEVEKFPALILDGEQITAGSLPPLDQLLFEIKRRSEIVE